METAMQWYFAKNGVQMGPIGIDELKAKLASGEVSGTDMVWREGMPDWRKAGEVQELAVIPAAPQQVVPQPTPSASNSPYSTPRAPSGYNPGPAIPNYLWQSIVVTVLCCVPFGIPAIVYAAKVDGLKARGDIQGAMAASKNAKMWCLIAMILGLIGFVVIIALQVFAATLSTPSASPGSF